MSDFIFIVFEDAVYRHRICGAFTDQQVAENMAERECDKGDGYHEICVASIPVNSDAESDVKEICRFTRHYDEAKMRPFQLKSIRIEKE